MKTNDHQHFYSLTSKDGSTTRFKVDDDKVTVSVETKCPVCQEHHDILGLTDILFLKNASIHIGRAVRGLPEGTFKIKYCPFCGRKL